MPVGRTTGGQLQRVPYGGALHFLPGVPLRTVNDREGFVSARVDYLNHLFTNSPYLVGTIDNPALANLDVLIPRVVHDGRRRCEARCRRLLKASVLRALEVQPLDMRDLETEVARLGSDMYIFLARQNVQIYLLGGLILALIGIFAVAYANYVEDRRTLALLRIRGAGPVDVVRFFMPNILGPSLVGLVIGSADRAGGRLRHHEAGVGSAPAADRDELSADPARHLAADACHRATAGLAAACHRRGIRPLGVCPHGQAGSARGIEAQRSPCRSNVGEVRRKAFMQRSTDSPVISMIIATQGTPSITVDGPR